MKVAMPLAKNVLAPLGLTAAMSAIDGSIKKKIADNKDLLRADKILGHKAYAIASNPQYDGYQRQGSTLFLKKQKKLS